MSTVNAFHNYMQKLKCKQCHVEDGMIVWRSRNRRDANGIALWTDEEDLVQAHPEEWGKRPCTVVVSVRELCGTCRKAAKKSAA